MDSGSLPSPFASCMMQIMPSITITISAEAHSRLKKNKMPGESFSDVVLRELPNPCDTAGELLDYYETHEVPRADPKRMGALRQGRGRRSHRPARRTR